MATKKSDRYLMYGAIAVGAYIFVPAVHDFVNGLISGFRTGTGLSASLDSNYQLMRLSRPTMWIEK